MNPLRHIALAATTLLAACNQAPPPDPDKAESYYVRLAVTPAEGAPEQRVALPISALSSLQSPDISDLRLFDGSGRALPIAVVQSRTVEEQAGTEVPVFPVIGAATPDTGGLALTIGPDNVARVSGLPAPAGEERPAAALLDTRKVADQAVAVTLDVDLPLHQPVTISLESSADLKVWEPLGEKVLFRTDSAGTQLEAGRIALPAVALKDRYLRASWGEIKGVSVRGARVVTSKTGARPPLSVRALEPKLTNPREVRFDLPLDGPIAALRVDPVAGEGVLLVRLAGRRDREAQWTPISAATLRNPGSPGNVIELSGSKFSEYRLFVDERTPGFAAPPKIELHFDPIVLVTRFSGKPPYTLAVGLKGAPSTLLAPEDIAPAGTAELISAQVESMPAVIGIDPKALDGAISQQKTVLWLVLLAGVAILGFAVIRLMRGQKEAPSE